MLWVVEVKCLPILEDGQELLAMGEFPVVLVGLLRVERLNESLVEGVGLYRRRRLVVHRPDAQEPLLQAVLVAKMLVGSTYWLLPTNPLEWILVTTSSMAAFEGAHTKIFSTPASSSIEIMPVIV